MTGTLSILYRNNGDGWITSWIPEYPGAVSQGRSKEEAREMVLDALNELMLAAREDEVSDDRETLDFEIIDVKSA